jgi:hypothetical protein
MNVLAIDPGPTQSAYVLWDGSRVIGKAIASNEDLRGLLLTQKWCASERNTHFAIEMIGHYGTGMPAGKEVFNTCVWIGRFIECWPGEQHELILRATIKTHICGSARGNDSDVRAALILRFGARGTKKNPGVLYGVTTHLWSAVAVAVCAYDRMQVSVYV